MWRWVGWLVTMTTLIQSWSTSPHHCPSVSHSWCTYLTLRTPSSSSAHTLTTLSVTEIHEFYTVLSDFITDNLLSVYSRRSLAGQSKVGSWLVVSWDMLTGGSTSWLYRRVSQRYSIVWSVQRSYHYWPLLTVCVGLCLSALYRENDLSYQHQTW